MNDRVGYVGGGNIAGILGLSPFRTPLDEYLLISGEEPEVITPEKREFFDDRRDLEPWAAKKFTRSTGMAVVKANQRYSDAEFPWAKAEIDFEVEDGGNGETKTVHPNAVSGWGDPDNEEPPLYVTAQAMWGMGVHPAPWCYVNALIGFDDHRVYKIECDSTLLAEIRHQAENFWRFHVEPRRHPAPTRVEDLLKLYKTDNGRAVEANADMREAVQQIVAAKQTIKTSEARKALWEYTIKGYMKDAATLTINGKQAATWKSRQDGTRVFRII